MIYIFFHAVGQYAPDRKPAWFLRLNPLGKVWFRTVDMHNSMPLQQELLQ